MSSFGQIIQNFDAAGAEKQNASFYNEQADRTNLVYQRKLQLLQSDQQDYNTKVKGMFAKNGISLSGSALDFYGQQGAKEMDEQASLKSQGAWDENLLRTKAQQASDAANKYSDPFRNLFTLGAGALSLKGAGG